MLDEERNGRASLGSPDNGNGGEIRGRQKPKQRLVNCSRSALVAFLWVSVIRLLKKGVALLV